MSRSLKSTLPGPRAYPVLGWRGSAMRYFKNPIAYMLDLKERWGDVACLVRGGNQPLLFRPGAKPTTTVFAFGAQNNRQVLTQPNVFESDYLRGPEKCEWLSDNLVAANRDDRVQQRRLLMPAFQRGHLKVYHTDLVRLTTKMIDRWRPGETIDLVAEIEQLMADVASTAFYGQEPTGGGKELAVLARKIAVALFSPVTMLPIDLPGSPYRKFLKLAEAAGETVKAEIEKRRKSGAQGEDALSMMVRALEEGQVSLSDTQLIGNTFSLFLAGHKAPSSALIWTLFLLAQHPEAAAQLSEELDGELAGRAPEFEEIWKLPVLDSVSHESMRVLSPAVILWRRLTSEATLGGYEIPVGSEVILSPYVTHVDPDIYPRPKRFELERWSQRKPTPFEYLPFSYGARKCLGAAFGEMLVKLVVAIVVQRFRLQMISGTSVKLVVNFGLTAKSLPMTVHRQDRQFTHSKGEVRGYIRSMVDFP